jgi:hypothetical protein
MAPAPYRTHARNQVTDTLAPPLARLPAASTLPQVFLAPGAAPSGAASCHSCAPRYIATMPLDSTA